MYTRIKIKILYQIFDKKCINQLSIADSQERSVGVNGISMLINYVVELTPPTSHSISFYS